MLKLLLLNHYKNFVRSNARLVMNSVDGYCVMVGMIIIFKGTPLECVRYKEDL